MKCIDDEEWETLKRHTAEHLRSRTWLGGAHSIVPLTSPVTLRSVEGNGRLGRASVRLGDDMSMCCP